MIKGVEEASKPTLSQDEPSEMGKSKYAGNPSWSVAQNAVQSGRARQHLSG